MKKIITLLFCVGTFATSFAQYNPGHRDDRYTYNQRDHFDRGNSFHGDSDFQIGKINREFDFKINVIQNNWSLRRHEKKVAIRQLERERARQIEIARFHDRRRGYDNHR